MGSVYTVGQINAYIKRMFAQDFLLNRVYVKGEVSNCKYHNSGHIYFSLKDETGAISCVMFSSSRKSLAFRLENGLRVVVFGGVSVYERDGTYQLYAKEIRLDGLGVLYERFQALKQELEEMGMFAPEYKQPIPAYVNRLGVVTAPTGAAVRDIINIARRRHPGIQIILYPAKVQGEGAAQSVARGIKVLDRLGVDVMIVGRGGGSMEDLWAFNEEIVARAIFECQTPVISAVGHETDTTIADYAADLRAPTPSAGAELAVTDMVQAVEALEQYRLRMGRLAYEKVERMRDRLDQAQMRLRMGSPQNKIRELKMRADKREDRLRHLMEIRLQEYKNRLLLLLQRYRDLSPLEKLSRGYALVTDEAGLRVSRATQVKPGQGLTLAMAGGQIQARAERVIPDGPPPEPDKAVLSERSEADKAGDCG